MSISATSNIGFTGLTGTISRQLIAGNSKRLGLIVTNTGTNVVYIALGTTAVAGRGIPLYSHEKFQLDHINHRGTVNGIGSTSVSTNVAWSELF